MGCGADFSLRSQRRYGLCPGERGRSALHQCGGEARVVINGTSLDYLAESFMAGDPHQGGGFVILNGMEYDPHGRLRDQPTPYPGSNLFSLASVGPSSFATLMDDCRRSNSTGENLPPLRRKIGGSFFPTFRKTSVSLAFPSVKIS